MIDGIDATVVKQITDAGNKIFQAPGMNINYMAYNTTKLLSMMPRSEQPFPGH
jgi:peptide/nickel transport system substrate-binding protein